MEQLTMYQNSLYTAIGLAASRAKGISDYSSRSKRECFKDQSIFFFSVASHWSRTRE
jgi:hypothetical protein